MVKILYGAPVRADIEKNLLEKISNLKEPLSLVVIQVGDRADSSVYVENKRRFGKKIGVQVIIKKFDLNVTEEELVEEIERVNKDESVQGVIIQLPLPIHLDSTKLLSHIDPQKNADGLTGDALGEDGPLVTPATARAVERLLDFYRLEVKGKKVAVIGRSLLAGGPIATSLQARGGEITVCHRETPNTEEVCKESDIIISAAGKPSLVTRDFVKAGQVIIDVGINRTQSGRLTGDVDFEEVKDIVSAITPVPGGVGPLTVACLFENLLDLASKSRV